MYCVILLIPGEDFFLLSAMTIYTKRRYHILLVPNCGRRNCQENGQTESDTYEVSISYTPKCVQEGLASPLAHTRDVYSIPVASFLSLFSALY